MTRVTRLNVGPRASGPPADVDLLRHLSERAHAERAPGQTLQSKLNELRREYDHTLVPSFSPCEQYDVTAHHPFAAPSDNLAPHCAGGAAIRG